MTIPPRLAAFMVVAGAVLVTVGMSLWSVAAGMVTAGAVLIGAGFVIDIKDTE